METNELPDFRDIEILVGLIATLNDSDKAICYCLLHIARELHSLNFNLGALRHK